MTARIRKRDSFAKKSAKPGILTINCGSSSIKFAQFEAGDVLNRIFDGEIDRIGSPEAGLRVSGFDPLDTFSRQVTAPDHETAVDILMDWIEERNAADVLTAVGHRVVHGDPNYYEPQHITTKMLAELQRLSPFGPSHLPEEILLAKGGKLCH